MFRMRMAEIVFEIHHRYDYIKKQCAAWQCSDSDEQVDLVIRVTDEEIYKEWENSEVAVSLEYCESICIYRMIAENLTPFSAFVMHGSVLELDEEAYVFTAKSGVGKTTHTRLWIDYFKGKATWLNGDKPIMRFQNEKLYAYGTPWMGKENYGRPGRVPVKVIYFLEQAKENRIRKAGDREIVDRLFHQVLLPWDPEKLDVFMDMMDRMVSCFPFFVLECNISMDAVKTAYEAINNQITERK